MQQAIDELSRGFGLAPGDTVQAVENEYLSSPHIPPSEWPALIAVLATSDKDADRKQGVRLEHAMRAGGRDRIDAYLDVFCTGERKGRSKHPDEKLRGGECLMGRQRSTPSKSASAPWLRANSRCARATAAPRCSPSPTR